MNKNSLGAPPPVMTWGKASLPITVAVVLWLLRFMFEMFWFFGPALLALGCTAAVNTHPIAKSVVSGGAQLLLGPIVSAPLSAPVLAASACTVAAAGVGFFGAPVIETLGVVMAMAIGFMGWLMIGFIILLTNRRVFKEDPLASVWFTGALVLDEIPLIGILPGLVGATWRVYHKQIKRDKKKLAEYHAAVAAQEAEERQMQIAQFSQERQIQMNQIAEMQEEEDNAYQAAEEEEEQEEMEAANDPEYTQDFENAA